MGRYLLRRLLYSVPILFGVALATFILFYAGATPRQLARRNLSARAPTEEQIQAWLREHGYDKSPPEQLARHLSELFLLRFGKSDNTGEEIWDRIRQGAGPSATVGLLIFIGSLLASVSAALVAAYFRGTYLDGWTTALCVFSMSIVYMVYIIIGQYLVAKVLNLAPIAGYGWGWDSLRFALLPALIGTVSGLGSSIRLYRTFMLDEISQDYVRTARAKGVPESRVLFRHVLKNAAIPILTSVVLSIPFIILGGLLLESFFSIPGIGGYLVDAINGLDFAVIRAMVFLGTLLYIGGSILTDVSYALADPRVRLA